jgi:hypothetical protein
LLRDIVDTGDARHEGRDVYLMALLRAHIAELNLWYQQLVAAMIAGQPYRDVESKYARAQRLEQERKRDGAGALASAADKLADTEEATS